MSISKAMFLDLAVGNLFINSDGDRFIVVAIEIRNGKTTEFDSPIEVWVLDSMGISSTLWWKEGVGILDDEYVDIGLNHFYARLDASETYEF